MKIDPKKAFLLGGCFGLLCAIIFAAAYNYHTNNLSRLLSTATSITVVSPRPSWVELNYADAIPPTTKLEFLTPPPTSPPTPSFVLIASGNASQATVILAPAKPEDSGTILTRPDMVAHYVSTVDALRSSASRRALKTTGPGNDEGSEGGRGGPSGFGLKVGMTFAEVRAVRGNPSGENTDGTRTFWSYDRVSLASKVATSAAANVAYKTRSAIGIPIVGDVLGGSASESIRSKVSYHALGLNFVNGRLVQWSATTLH